MAWFRARYTYHDIYQITGEALARRGFKLLLADLDNTLAPYGVPLPDERLKGWRDDLAAHGVTLFILSNNRHESRPRLFAEGLDAPYIGHAGKPKTPAFFKAMERVGATREQTAIVGDQVFKSVDGSFSAIPGGELHPQSVAPGFVMYTCWMIRHLDGKPWLQTDRCEDKRYTWLHDAKF